jgi:hypothetical protein
MKCPKCEGKGAYPKIKGDYSAMVSCEECKRTGSTGEPEYTSICKRCEEKVPSTIGGICSTCFGY